MESLNRMDLRVLMVTPYFPPIINGPSLHVSHLVNGLVKKGVTVHVHTMAYDLKEGLNMSNQGFTISYSKPFSFLRNSSFDQPISFSYLRSVIDKSNKFDLIHVHDYPKLCNDSLILTLKKVKPHKPVLLTPHGAGPVAPANKLSSKAYWASKIPITVASAADHLITVTPLQEKVFSKVCRAEKISMIYEAIPPEYFINAPSFIEDGVLKVLFIGRLIEEKGICDLLKAVKIFSDKSLYKIQLRLVGPDYGFMQKVKQLIAQLGLEKIVHVIGSVTETEKLFHLSWCDVLVLPSYYEAFGIPIVEAMARGKPVIATKTVGAVSLIKDNETGFLVNFNSPQEIADRLLQFVKNPSLKYYMGQKALVSVIPFSMENMIKDHIDLYERLLDNRPQLTLHKNKI